MKKPQPERNSRSSLKLWSVVLALFIGLAAVLGSSYKSHPLLAARSRTPSALKPKSFAAETSTIEIPSLRASARDMRYPVRDPKEEYTFGGMSFSSDRSVQFLNRQTTQDDSQPLHQALLARVHAWNFEKESDYFRFVDILHDAQEWAMENEQNEELHRSIQNKLNDIPEEHRARFEVATHGLLKSDDDPGNKQSSLQAEQ